MPLNLSSLLKLKKNLSVKYSDEDKIYDVVKINLASNSFNQNLGFLIVKCCSITP